MTFRRNGITHLPAIRQLDISVKKPPTLSVRKKWIPPLPAFITLPMVSAITRRWQQLALTLGAIRKWIFENYPNDPFVDVAGKAIIGNAAQDKLMVFKIDTPTNEPGSKTISGWELTVQHAFGDTGFGVIGNYTLVDSDTDYDNFLLRDQTSAGWPE